MKKFIDEKLLERIGLGGIAAFGTWLIIFSISVYWLPSADESIRDNSGVIVFLFIAYISCFFAITNDKSDHTSPTFYFLYGSQLACAFALMWLLPINFLPILTVIWVALLPHFTTLKRSLMICLVVIIVWFVLYDYRWDERNTIFNALLYSTFYFFAIFMTYETVKAENARNEADRLNKELQATQHLLAQASRQNERTRIARDLHDLLGHHLTALIINLQVAGHISEGEAKSKIEQCHSLAKLLLSDVREAVSTLRDNQQLEFTKMLSLMCEQVPKLTIHQQIETSLSLEQMHIARALLSCIQEAITNTLKHSNANEFWIALTKTDEQLYLKLNDNGSVKNKLIMGNGLKGMQERIEELNGHFNFTIIDNALHIDIAIPTNQIAASQLPINELQS